MPNSEFHRGLSDHSPQGSTIRLLLCGALTPLVFWTTISICGTVLGNYNHFSRMVSELGRKGTPTQFLFTAGLLSCSVLSVLFVLGLRRICHQLNLCSLPAWLILSYSFSIAGAGLFPLPLRMHEILGMPSVALVLSPLTALVLWYRADSHGYLKVMACLAFAIMSLGFLAFSETIMSSLPGLKQRFFHLGWSIWFIYLSISCTQALKGKQPELGSMRA